VKIKDLNEKNEQITQNPLKNVISLVTLKELNNKTINDTNNAFIRNKVELDSSSFRFKNLDRDKQEPKQGKPLYLFFLNNC